MYAHSGWDCLALFLKGRVSCSHLSCFPLWSEMRTQQKWISSQLITFPTPSSLISIIRVASAQLTADPSIVRCLYNAATPPVFALALFCTTPVVFHFRPFRLDASIARSRYVHSSPRLVHIISFTKEANALNCFHLQFLPIIRINKTVKIVFMKSRTRNVRGSKKSTTDTRTSTSVSTSSTLASTHPTTETVNIHSFTSKMPGAEGNRPDTSQRVPTTTSMETEYIEELYSKMSMQEDVNEPHSGSRIDFDLDDDDDNYIDCSDDADGEYDDHDENDHHIHGDISNSTQNTILMELQREHLEFEENVRQLQRQLRQQSSLETFEEGFSSDDNLSEGSIGSPFPSNDLNSYDMDYFLETTGMCARCVDPKPTLCLETYGRFWRPFIVRAMATAAAAIAQYHDIQGTRHEKGDPFSNFLPRPQQDIQAANNRNM